MFETITQILHTVNWGEGNDQAETYPKGKQGYLVVYMTVNTFVQAVPFDQTFWSNVEQNVDIFF